MKVFPEIIIKNDTYWEIFEVCKKTKECNDIKEKLKQVKGMYTRWTFSAMTPRQRMLDEVPDLMGVIYKKIEGTNPFLFNPEFAVLMDQ